MQSSIYSLETFVWGRLRTPRLPCLLSTEMELLSFPRITEQERCVIKELLSNCTIFPLDNEVKNRAICLRCGFGMKLSDAIVAATALVKHLPLITADKGFARLPDLKLYLLKP